MTTTTRTTLYTLHAFGDAPEPPSDYEVVRPASHALRDAGEGVPAEVTELTSDGNVAYFTTRAAAVARARATIADYRPVDEAIYVDICRHDSDELNEFELMEANEDGWANDPRVESYDAGTVNRHGVAFGGPAMKGELVPTTYEFEGELRSTKTFRVTDKRELVELTEAQLAAVEECGVVIREVYPRADVTEAHDPDKGVDYDARPAVSVEFYPEENPNDDEDERAYTGVLLAGNGNVLDAR